MKNYFFIVWVCIVCGVSSVSACDSCGAGGSDFGVGLLTNYKSNYLRLSYQQFRFNTSSNDHSEGSDLFNVTDLSFRFALGKKKRIRLRTHVPYKFNHRVNEEEDISESGLADVLALAHYVLLSNKALDDKTKLYMDIGGGFSLPTGNYDDDIHEKNLPENFNVGKGSLGYVFQLNTVLGLGKSGIVWNNTSQFNLESPDGYQFGKSLNSRISIFRELELKKLKLIPNLSFSVDGTSKDQHANGNEVVETGGFGAFISSQINLKTQKWLLGISMELPISQNYAGGETQAIGRIATQFSYIF